MLTRTKRTLAALAITCAVGTAAAPGASAQQQGLVNVDVHNVLNNNNVQLTIPINAAANICGVSVPVLSSGLASGPVSCTARGNQQITVTGPA